MAKYKVANVFLKGKEMSQLPAFKDILVVQKVIILITTPSMSCLKYR